jgi:hypothetical protein
MPGMAVAKLMHQISSVDLGMDCLRDLLPAHGFKLVAPPPMTNGMPSAFASVWRYGEARAVSHRGSTAARALLHAVESELVKLHDVSAMAACSRCRGVGWFVTDAGSVEICRHAEMEKYLTG